MLKAIAYHITAFILDNWKRSVKTVIAVYLVTMGLTILVGTGVVPGLALPGLNMTIPMG